LNRRQFVTAAACATSVPVLAAASPAASQEQKWLAIAESLKPRLRRTPVTPAGIVQMAADPTQFLHWRVERVSPPEALSERLLRRGDSAIVDFGHHVTGHLSFSIAGEGRGVDAPARLKLTFGEAPADVAQPFDPYTGGLGRAWLEDEMINLDVLPAVIEMPRRYAFRYVKLLMVDTSPNANADLSPYGSVLVNSYCHAGSCTPAYLLRSLNLAGK
jgi:hypothetical protein